MNFLKNKNSTAAILFYSILLLVSSYSFFQHSPLTGIWNNSDTGVHILMTQHLELPGDFYYWGQNRLGSFLPILTWPFVHIFGLNVITAISLVQYALLISTVLLLCTFIKDNFLRVLFGIYWFLPLPFFYEHLEIGQPYSSQFFLIALSLFLLHKIANEKYRSNTGLALLYSGLFFGTFLSVWVSELSLGYVLVLCIYICYRVIKKIIQKRNESFYRRITQPEILIPLLTFLIIASVVICFISYIKSIAPVNPAYEQVFSPIDEMIDGVKMLFHSIKKTVLFGVRNVLVSYHAILILAISIFVIIYSFRYRAKLNSNGLILICSAGIVLAGTVTNNWVRLNSYEMRYFIFAFYLFIAGLFIVVSELHLKNIYRSVIRFFFFAFTFFAVYFSMSRQHLNYDIERSYSQLEKFSTYSNAGFIGDYWSSYLIASSDPENIAATPSEEIGVRNISYAYEVVSRPHIFLIANDWLEYFPDTISQFGIMLSKGMTSDTISGYAIQQYDKIPYKRNFSLRELKTEFQYLSGLNDSDSRIIQTDDSKKKLLAGRYVSTLAPGNYILSCETGKSNASENDSIWIRISPVYSPVLAEKFLTGTSFITDTMQTIQVPFTVEEFTQHFELNVFSSGSGGWFLRKMELVQQ